MDIIVISMDNIGCENFFTLVCLSIRLLSLPQIDKVRKSTETKHFNEVGQIFP